MPFAASYRRAAACVPTAQYPDPARSDELPITLSSIPSPFGEGCRSSAHITAPSIFSSTGRETTSGRPQQKRGELVEDQPHPVLSQLRCHRCACNDPSRNVLINGGDLCQRFPPRTTILDADVVVPVHTKHYRVRIPLPLQPSVYGRVLSMHMPSCLDLHPGWA